MSLCLKGFPELSHSFFGKVKGGRWTPLRPNRTRRGFAPVISV
nr:MAG TPA: hypothetical protein [Caudoviricetes sp.]